MFVDLGAKVIVIARSDEDIKKIKNTYPKNIEGLSLDLSEPANYKRAINFVNDKFGKLDILVNNVGVNIRKKTIEYSAEEYQKILNTNLTSAFELSRLAHPMLKNSADPCIVNISSVAGQIHLRTGSIYGMTKSAMIQLTKNLAGEWGKDKIRVNAVAPWYINTPLAQAVLKDKDYYNEVLSRTPLNKIGEPEDVASAVAFLCMPQAKFITGQCLSIDGGFTINGF
jgi:Tropinone reductase 1